MGATNNTTYYNLSQFVGTDKPAWLQDYNGDMGKIDAGIHQAKAAADAAQGDATQALTDSGNNTTAIGNIQTDVGNLQTAVGNNTGSITTINSLIGNGTPTTTDQTIIGAINELNADKIEYKTAEAVGDGVKTVSELLDELFAYIDNVTPYAMIVNYFGTGQYSKHELMAIAPTQITFGRNTIGSSESIIENLLIRSTGSSQRSCTLKYSDNSISYASFDSTVPNAGDKYVLYY